MLAQRQALAEQRWADVDADGLSAFLADGLAPVVTREEQQDWINFVIASEWNRLLSNDLKRQVALGLRAFYGDDVGDDET